MPTSLVKSKMKSPRSVSVILSAPEVELLDSLVQKFETSRSEVVRVLIRRYGPNLQKV